MSHIVDVHMKARDLDALAEAGDRCGFTLNLGQQSHTWFGRFVGDTVPPPSRSPRDFGQCDHALRLKDHRAGDYEIGVVQALDGDGFDLRWDTWGASGRRLIDAAGPEMNRLRQQYSAAVISARARKKLAPKGFTTTREDLPGGRIRLRLRRR